MVYLARFTGIILIIIALMITLGLIIAYTENDIPQDLLNRPWSILFIPGVIYLGVKLLQYNPEKGL